MKRFFLNRVGYDKVCYVANSAAFFKGEAILILRI
jgi:hypothetical protein